MAQPKKPPPETVMIRRGADFLDNYPTRALVEKIRKGDLLPTDELSVKGKKWIRLEEHPQLSKFFKKKHKIENLARPEELEADDEDEEEKQPMAKWKIVAMAGVVILIGYSGWYYAQPYLTLIKLKVALEKQNKNELVELIDFPSVQKSLKEQVIDPFVAGLEAKAVDNPLMMIGVNVAREMSPKMLKIMVTPENLIRLTNGVTLDPAHIQMRKTQPADPSGQAPGGDPPSEPAETPKEPLPKPFERGEARFRSLAEFVVSVPDAKGRIFEFILTRGEEGDWRLTQVMIPR